MQDCGTICFAVLYFKMSSLATVWKMDCSGSRVEGEEKLRSCCYCLGERDSGTDDQGYFLKRRGQEGLLIDWRERKKGE